GDQRPIALCRPATNSRGSQPREPDRSRNAASDVSMESLRQRDRDRCRRHGDRWNYSGAAIVVAAVEIGGPLPITGIRMARHEWARRVEPRESSIGAPGFEPGTFWSQTR